MAIKICPNCGGKVSLTRNTCPHCKYEFKKMIKCPSCEEEIEDGLNECPICGHEFNMSSNSTNENENIPNLGSRIVSISCPNCASSDAIKLGNNEYRCGFCNATFAYNDGKPLIVNNYNISNENPNVFENGFELNKTVSLNDFKRSFVIKLLSISDVPEDILNRDFSFNEEVSQVYSDKFDIKASVNCSCGYKQMEIHQNADGAETYRRIAVNWKPFNGTAELNLRSSCFSNEEPISFEFNDLIDSLRECDYSIIEYPSSYPETVHKTLEAMSRNMTEQSITIPGDCYKDESYTSSSRILEKDYYIGTKYSVNYKYDKEEYSAYGFGYGMPNAFLKCYPAQKEDMEKMAKRSVAPGNAIITTIKVLSSIFVVLSMFIVLPFATEPIGSAFYFIPLFVSPTLLFCMIMEKVIKKRHNRFLKELKRIRIEDKISSINEWLEANKLEKMNSSETQSIIDINSREMKYEKFVIDEDIKRSTLIWLIISIIPFIFALILMA